MATPQQNEVRRSTHNAADPDGAKSALTASKQPAQDDAAGPVPEDNQPGHHPEVEQDKPDL
jgi:hypothetical protein